MGSDYVLLVDLLLRLERNNSNVKFYMKWGDFIQ
jgi:hypothetical protein